MSLEPETSQQVAFYQKLPKVELHRHLEGSLRVGTMMAVARKYGLAFPVTGALRPLVQVQAEEPYTFRNFLAKFNTLRLFYRSPEIIARITSEAVADAAADHVAYLELTFTPFALSRAQGYSLGEVMDWVCDSARQAEKEFGVTTRLLASVNRHEDPALAEEVAEQAAARMDRGVCGMSLAGNEAEFSALPFAPVLREARQSGLHITAHAGEWAGAHSVREAIETLGAERIGHGVRVLEDAAVVSLARERGIPFEVCITSNYQTGSVPNMSEHPLSKMLAAGLNVTLNTDDPGISQITLSDEYRLACEDLGLPKAALIERILAAAQAAFLPENERQALVKRISQELPANRA